MNTLNTQQYTPATMHQEKKLAYTLRNIFGIETTRDQVDKVINEENQPLSASGIE
jgi:hypothetical protein